MKSQVIENQTKPITYPCVMKSNTGDELVVLMRVNEKGTVLNSGKSSFYDVGDYVDHWNMNAFEPFYGQVIVSNQ